MKVPVITDTHWGVRNDNQTFLEYFKRSMDNFFLPYIDENNVTEVLHLGDLVDRRKYINFLTAKRLREDFLDPLMQRGITMHVALGNHDIYYRNTSEVNALQELLEMKYPTLHVYHGPTEITLDNLDLLMLPWINSDNRNDSYEAIQNTKAPVAMGHLEIMGAEWQRGLKADHGMDRSLFNRFDLVASGHYHHRHIRGNIHYIGAFCEHNWGDWNDPRGFSVLDTQTRELEFHQNPFNMFHMMTYDDEANKDILQTINETDYSKYEGTYVRVVCQNKKNPYAFDRLIDKLQEVGPVDISIVEDAGKYELTNDEIVEKAQDTQTLIRDYVMDIELPVENTKVRDYMLNIYNEALTIQEME